MTSDFLITSGKARSGSRSWLISNGVGVVLMLGHGLPKLEAVTRLETEIIECVWEPDVASQQGISDSKYSRIQVKLTC